MKSLPESKLPELARPWERALVAELEATQRENTNLASALDTLNEKVVSMTDQLTRLQNYVGTLCDLGGYEYPPAAEPPVIADPEPTPGVPTPPAVVRSTITVDAAWSCSWGSGGFKYNSPGNGDTDSRSLYQAGSGTKFAMWRFDIGPARNTKIIQVELFLSNISTYYNGAFTALLGTHGNENEPGGKPGGRENGFNIGWTRAEGKWVAIPDWAYNALSDGSIQGFTLGDGTNSRQNYARFNGVGRAGAPQLRITYEA